MGVRDTPIGVEAQGRHLSPPLREHGIHHLAIPVDTQLPAGEHFPNRRDCSPAGTVIRQSEDRRTLLCSTLVHRSLHRSCSVYARIRAPHGSDLVAIAAPALL